MITQTNITNIKKSISCVDVARNILNLPVNKPGDRCTSIAPGEHTHKDGFVVYHDYWQDFSLNQSGDCFDLLMLAKNLSFKEAVIELAHMAGIDISDDIDTVSFFSQRNRILDDIDKNVKYWHEALRPEDREYLHSRGITDQTIDSLMIGYSKNQQRLIIPYTKNHRYVYWTGRDRSPDGTLNQDGSPRAKYTKMKLKDDNGQDTGLENIPWGFDTLIRRNTDILHTEFGDFRKDQFLIIPEGVFDAVSFWQEGFRLLSPFGGKFNVNFYPVLRDASRNAEFVVLAFDSDSAGSAFTMDTAKSLIQNGKKILCINLPEGVKDVSDFYAPGGNLDNLVSESVSVFKKLSENLAHEDFRKFLSSCVSDMTSEDVFKGFIESVKQSGVVENSDLALICSKAGKLDRGFVAQCKKEILRGFSEKDLVDKVIISHNLVYIDNDGFYEYSDGVWKRKADLWIKNYLYKLLGDSVSAKKLTSVTTVLKAACMADIVFNKKNIFVFQNGTLELDTLNFREHSPDDYATIKMTYEYQKNAKSKRWEKFISEVMSHDSEKIRLIRQACGYVLFPNCCLQKAFILKGKGANGKSTFLEILRHVFGHENCKSVEISQLATPFQAIHLKDALVNLCAEVRTNFNNADSMVKKLISGDEGIHDSYKGKDSIEFTPRVKNFFAVNSYITSNNIDYALLRRLIFIGFNERYEGRKADPTLNEKLKEELPGIFNWILEGYLDLLERKNAREGFSETEESKKIKQDFLLCISPVDTFINDELRHVYAESLSLSGLYLKYCGWCKDSGNTAMSRGRFKQVFGDNIELHRKDVEYRYENGKDFWYFTARSEAELLAMNSPEPEPTHEPEPVPEPKANPEVTAQSFVKPPERESRRVIQPNIERSRAMRFGGESALRELDKKLEEAARIEAARLEAARRGANPNEQSPEKNAQPQKNNESTAQRHQNVSQSGIHKPTPDEIRRQREFLDQEPDRIATDTDDPDYSPYDYTGIYPRY